MYGSVSHRSRATSAISTRCSKGRDLQVRTAFCSTSAFPLRSWTMPSAVFPIAQDAPLDMRMDRQQKLTAYDVVNGWSREEIRRILFEYGEERYAPLIAAAIERERADKPIETTLELVRVIKGAMPAKALREKQHPAKRSFQAIRIAVNDELGAVREAMEKPSTVSIRAADWRSSPSTAWRTASSRRLFSRRHRAAPVRRTFRYASAAKAEGSADAAQADSAGRKGN